MHTIQRLSANDDLNDICVNPSVGEGIQRFKSAHGFPRPPFAAMQYGHAHRYMLMRMEAVGDTSRRAEQFPGLESH